MAPWIYVGGLGIVLVLISGIIFLLGRHRSNKYIKITGIGFLIAGFCAFSVGACLALDSLLSDEQALVYLQRWIGFLMGGQFCGNYQ